MRAESNSARIRRLFACLKTLFELVDSSAGIDELLLTREERVALRANFNLDLSALGRSGNDLRAASAGNHALFVLGMQSLFHIFHLR